MNPQPLPFLGNFVERCAELEYEAGLTHCESPRTLSSRSTRRFSPARARRFNLHPSLEIELSSRKLDFMGISASLYRSESLL
jgi:hypothetical protein